MTTYTLHHGDCLEIMPTLDAGSVDAVICDPPYGTTACKWDSVIPFAPMWEQIKRLLKPRGACVLFGSQPFTSALVMSNPAWFRYEWVWEKTQTTGFFDANRRPMKAHENILVFAKGQTTYNPQKTRAMPHETKTDKTASKTRLDYTSVYHSDNAYKNKALWKETGLRFPKSVIRFPNWNGALFGKTHKATVHPTQKPLALLEYLVKTYTDEGDTVLDFTMGSGTTGHACMNLGRRFIGIEQDAGYFALAQERIADAADPLRHMAALTGRNV
jgi:site-specific DNA-methyltransferase (adenine-specific)